jgi:conjugal transfer/type IV secretion protein DotA/TraY
MTANTQKINVKSVLSYAVLPGILPRAKALGNSGFGYLAFLFACAYRAVRILPKGHPYTNPANIGSFGLFKVMAASANHVRVSWKTADQVVIFFALMAAIAIMFLQFLLLAITIFTGKAFANNGGASFTSMFQTQRPANDLAFTLLDLVFGIPAGTGAGPNLGFFGSAAIPTGPTPFHEGLHALFNFYNLALLLVGVLIFMYYVIVVVIETAQTGVPFGARFSKLYAPMRLVVAVGLLVPLNYGFNGAQYVTLYAAKIGSSFATNGWLLYNETLVNPTGGENTELVGRPRAPNMDGLLYFASVYHACREMYKIWVPENGNTTEPGITIAPYVIVNGAAEEFLSYNYSQAKRDFGHHDLEVVLGELNEEENSSFAGNVRPYCGRITISLSNDNPSNFTSLGGTPGGGASPSGVREIERNYYHWVRLLLNPATNNPFVAFGERAAHSNVSNPAYDPCHESGILGDAGTCGQTKDVPPASAFDSTIANFRAWNEVSAETAYTQYLDGLDASMSPDLQDRGWGGAGIWYNHIADLNGAFTSATYAIPSVKAFPEVMEYIQSQKAQQDQNTDSCHAFEPNLADGRPVDYKSTYDDEIATALNVAYSYFACKKPNQETGTVAAAQSSGTTGCPTSFETSALTRGTTANAQETNPIVGFMSAVFGVNGLFELRSASCWDNATGRPSINPLAQLSTLGRSLVENAIRAMGFATVASLAGGFFSPLNASLGGGFQAASSMFVGIATIGLTAGFILYYILPFLPFIYFFFAVGSWVKSIFEAMIGAPLWALAHLHIDGDGLPGRAAVGGYFLIFEIFLRPIVIVFGLIAGMAVFTAMAGILNNIFDLVVLNTSGAVPGGSNSVIATSAVDQFRRGVIDQFFYTIMYAILLYMMATASFKLIDNIPAQIMRWIGSGVSTFNDNKGDPAGGLTGYAAIGGSQITGQVLGGVQQAAGGIGGLGGSLVKTMIKP